MSAFIPARAGARISAALRLASFAPIALTALLFCSCLYVSEGGTNGEISGNSTAGGTIEPGKQESNFLAFKDVSIASFDVKTGKQLWESKLDARVYPFAVRPAGKSGGKFLYTWITENASINSALTGSDLTPILSARDASPTAIFESRVAMEFLERPGPEGTHSYRTEIWNADAGTVESSFPLAYLLKPAAPSAKPDSAIILSGPDSTDSIDIYGHTTREKVSRIDLNTGKTLFSTSVPKDYGSSFDLVAATQSHILLAYKIDVLQEEMVCIGSGGKIAWRRYFGEQIHRTPLFPFNDAFSRIVCALSPDESKLCAFSVPAPGRWRVFELDVSNGKQTWEITSSGGPTLPNAIKYAEGFVEMEYGYGARYVKLDASSGAKISEFDVAKRPSDGSDGGDVHVFKHPSGAYLKTAGRFIETGLKDGGSKLFPLASFAGRLPEKVEFAGDGGSIMHAVFSKPGQESDLSNPALEAIINAKTGKIIAGDQLDPNGWLFYGRGNVVIAGDNLYELGILGKPVKTIPLFGSG